MMFGRLFPRMYTGVVAGLIDGRHHKRLGAAWMLFQWCVMRQTGQGEEGIVARGSVVTYAQIADEMNCKRGSVREWMARLIREAYVRIERDRRGIRIFVRNPKKFRVSEVQHSKSPVSAGSSAGGVSEPQLSKAIHVVENAATSEILLRSDLTKLPRNNNTTAAAKAAAVYLSSPVKEKSIPRANTKRQLDERRRLLLKQSEQIKARYGAHSCN